MGWTMESNGKQAEAGLEQEGVMKALGQAQARLRGAMEELPPLEELAALQEAMVGLAQMGAVLRVLRRTSQQNTEAEGRPADEHDS